ncbi:DddA-like double-stranded DNA deaminase toxin [Actinorhabdospora filicis]|uniref:DddA-like double-stranded DNA deaminase toxin n=1 Tax=Actinorhabdospora filicis TaxID=1785913 RepID=UPI002552F7DD|nr:DddA-like double-stranded DNA deaminase toxin [Actinorhabdospora filicis]
MGPFEEFMGKARRGLETLAEAFGLLRAAQEKNGLARAELSSATEGTGNARIDASLSRLEQVGEALAEGLTHGIAGRETFAEYLTDIGAGAALGASEPPSTGERPAAVAPEPEPLQLRDFRAEREHPEAKEAIRRVGWPRNSVGNTSARAHLYDEHGNRMGDTYTPDTPDDHPHWDDLKPEWNNPENTTTSWHVEGRMAKAIRDSGLTRAAVYLNIRRCGGVSDTRPRPDPKGCTENFRHTLKAGTVVYVYVIQENGRTFRQRVTGTGKALKE